MGLGEQQEPSRWEELPPGTMATAQHISREEQREDNPAGSRAGAANGERRGGEGLGAVSLRTLLLHQME